MVEVVSCPDPAGRSALVQGRIVIACPAMSAIAWRHGPPLPADRPITVPAWLDGVVRRHGRRTVLVADGVAWTWDALMSAAAGLAGRLADRLGPGDRLAIVCPNGAAHLVAELAAWRLGACAAPVFTGFPPARLRAILAMLDPAVVLVADPLHAALVAPGVRTLTAAEALAGGPPGPERAVGPDTPCLIQCTSGSTGEPRGVILGHDNLVSQQAAFAMMWPEIGAGDRLAAYLPWHHSFGGLAERLWAVGRGACLHVVPGGGRDRERFLRTVRDVRPTVFFSVPKMHRTVIEADALDRACLRWVFTAGAPMPVELAAWYEGHGITVAEGWGLTETSPSATLTRPGDRRRPGIVGQPIPGVAVGVADDGRILVRGPNVMHGYFRRPTPALVAEGAMRTFDTGDLGAWTDGGLLLTGRADHVVKLTNGEKVHLAELEARLAAQPGIQHAVVCTEGDALVAVLCAGGRSEVDLAGAVAAVNDRAEAPYLRIAAAWRITVPPDLDNGLVTASHKLARGRLVERFRVWRADGGTGFEPVGG